MVDNIKDWLDWEFSSGGTTGEDFKRFARDFRKSIKEKLPERAELVNWNNGHYYVSGFVKRENKYVYFSISDVRFFKDDWYGHILIRTAENDKDYTGGSNCFILLESFTREVDKLLN